MTRSSNVAKPMAVDPQIDPQDTPARRIIKRFGGLSKAARAWRKSKSTIQRWQESGYIHPNYHDDILTAAVAEKITLDPKDFNLVDTAHPAFNAPCTPSSDSTAGHTPGSSTHPIPETSGSPADECKSGCGVER
jgi:hypothetical protein